MFKTRQEFLREVMRLTGLPTLKEADRVVQVVIGLIKARIGPELSDRIAAVSPPDLAKGWTRIALPGEALEMQEMMFELEEVGEEVRVDVDEPPPEYG